MAVSSAKRVVWAMVDQAVSSLGNLAFGLLAAQTLSVTEFGAFGVAFATYIVVLGTIRALTSDALIVRWSAHEPQSQLRAIRASLGAVLVLAVPLALVCAIVGWSTNGALSSAMLGLALALPALMAQDAYRFAFLTQGRPRWALVADLVWGLGLVGVALADLNSVGQLIVAWGVVNLVATILSIWVLATPKLQEAGWWWRESRDIGGRFVIEVLAINAALQVSNYAVAGFGGLTDAAGFRGAQLLLGPLSLLFVGGQYALIPEGVRAAAKDASAVGRIVPTLTFGLMGIAGIYSVVLVFLPDSLLRLALNDQTAAATRPLILPLSLAFVAAAVHVSAGMIMRMLQDIHRAFVTRMMLFPFSIAGGVGGAALDGARGASYGVLAANTVGAVLMAIQVRNSLHDPRLTGHLAGRHRPKRLARP